MKLTKEHIGKKVRRTGWKTTLYMIPEFIGRSYVVATDNTNIEHAFYNSSDWEEIGQVYYQMGDAFMIDGEEFRLVQVLPGRMLFINEETGNRYHDEQLSGVNAMCISQSDIDDYFELVKAYSWEKL